MNWIALTECSELHWFLLFTVQCLKLYWQTGKVDWDRKPLLLHHALLWSEWNKKQIISRQIRVYWSHKTIYYSSWSLHLLPEMRCSSTGQKMISYEINRNILVQTCPILFVHTNSCLYENNFNHLLNCTKTVFKTARSDHPLSDLQISIHLDFILCNIHQYFLIWHFLILQHLELLMQSTK